MSTRVDEAFRKQMQGYGLTTAKILYRMPDHLSIIQTYVWQEYDLYPEFPQLHHFLDFWRTNLEGPLHAVSFVHVPLIGASDFKPIHHEFYLN